MWEKLISRLADALHAPLRRRGREDPHHTTFPEFIDLVTARAAPVVLELGAREVSGVSRRQCFTATGTRYIGFDLFAGPGVDLVGDAHALSAHVAAGSVDAVFSFSVFEHLAFPWKVALEINRVLKPGGLVYISTHPVWPPHELPADYWRYPVAGLATLFGPALGFSPVAAREGLRAKLYSLVDDPPTRGVRHGKVPLAVSVIARKVADYDPARFRWDLESAALPVVYPAPTGTGRAGAGPDGARPAR